MTILQTKFDPIPVVIENITASAHIIPTMLILHHLIICVVYISPVSLLSWPIIQVIDLICHYMCLSQLPTLVTSLPLSPSYQLDLNSLIIYVSTF